MGRITYSIVALVVVLLAVLPALNRSQREQAETPLPPRVSGQNNTVLFLTTEQHGSSNVHLATSFALLEHHPSVKVHYASFHAYANRVARISEAATRKHPAAQQIQFHQLPEPSFLTAGILAGRRVADITHPPGYRGLSDAMRDMQIFMSPWSAEDHYTLYAAIMNILEEVDPAVVVLEAMLAPAFDAMGTTNRLHVILSPNGVAHFEHLQPWMKSFWKYPALITGFPFPVPWKNIPENIYVYIRIILAVLKVASPNEKRQFLEDKGIKKPLNLFDRYQPDIPWISASSKDAETSLPMEFMPPNVSLVGPMVISTASATEQDAVLAAWVSSKPTVLVNLGTVQRYSEESARAMADVLSFVLNNTDVQVLWKMKKHPDKEFNDDFLAPLATHISSGRAKVESWISVDPPSLLEIGTIALSVHHGGANCYFEAMRAGVPQVVLPLWLDTYAYAGLVEHIGVGVWGSKKAAPSWTVEELSKAMLRVLDGGLESTAIKQKAQTIGEQIQKATPGRDAAANIIAGLAASGSEVSHQL